MNEQEARTTIILWAEDYFRAEGEPKPEAEIVSIEQDKDDEDIWTAELEVSNSADNPTVTFYVDEQHGMQIQNVEY